jgi:replicative DNA helicase
MDEIRKIPPHSLDAEQSLLAILLCDNSAFCDVAEILRGDEFYKDAHRQIYSTISDLMGQSAPADLVTVAEHLSQAKKIEAIGGYSYLASLTDFYGTSDNLSRYAEIVREKADLRKLIQYGNQIICSAYNQDNPKHIIDSAQAAIFSLTENRDKRAFVPIFEVVKGNVEIIEKAMEHRDITGLKSGFKDLDKYTAGFQNSDFVIVAGRPGMGKSALALCIARNVEQPVGFFSLEMSKEQLSMRLLCAEARVDSQKVRTGYLSKKECGQLLAAAPVVGTRKILIDDTPGISPLEVRAKSRRLKMSDQGLGLVIIDYLQLMRCPGQQSREQEISEISRSLKALAKELTIPVIALAQLNRKVEERQNKRPILSDLRESGSLEQDADVVLFLYRDEVYDKESANWGIAEVNIGKQRMGPSGDTVKLSYISAYTKFEGLADGY